MEAFGGAVQLEQSPGGEWRDPKKAELLPEAAERGHRSQTWGGKEMGWKGEDI